MSADILLPMHVADEDDTPSAREHFAERRRIALLEPDRALRSVLARTLLRLGCVVSLARDLEQVLEALRDGRLDGAVVALDVDARTLALLQSANGRGVPVVVTTDEPHPANHGALVHCLLKPFDTRDLLAHLNLPHKAVTSSDGSRP